MTFLELQDAVLQNRFNDTHYRPFVKRVLNEAQNRVARRAKLRSQYEVSELSAVAGDRDVDVPADFSTLREVADSTDTTDWRILEPMELRDFDEAATSVGTPTNYVLVGGSIHLYPTPDVDTTLTVSYQRLPAEMTADDDTPEIPSDYHYLLEYWALYRCFNRENDIEQAQVWRAEFEQELNHLRAETTHDDSDPSFPRQVPSMWESTPWPSFRTP